MDRDEIDEACKDFEKYSKLLEDTRIMKCIRLREHVEKSAGSMFFTEKPMVDDKTLEEKKKFSEQTLLIQDSDI